MITGIGTPNSQSKIPLSIVTLLNTETLRFQCVISPAVPRMSGTSCRNGVDAAELMSVAMETGMSLNLLTQYISTH